jgi:hypothetical protein
VAEKRETVFIDRRFKKKLTRAKKSVFIGPSDGTNPRPPMKMDLERIGARQRAGNAHQFAAESEELDQIAKEVRARAGRAVFKRVLAVAVGAVVGV